MSKSAEIISLDEFRRQAPPSIQTPTIIERATFHKKAASRKGRPGAWQAWWKAEREYEVWVALRKLHRASTCAARCGVDIGRLAKKQNGFIDFDDRDHSDGGISDLSLLNALREAEAALIRTPAPTQAQITWKKSQLKHMAQHPTMRVHISEDEAKRCIAEDEAWHAANPIRKKRGASNE